jgi:hypothetical protein
MLLSTARNVGIDRLAIGLSGLCLVNCVASAVLVTMLASAGGLLDPRIHEIGLGFALVLGSLGLGRGVFTHGFMMPSSVGGIGLGTMAGSMTMGETMAGTLFSVLGVMILALGHDLNRRAAS